jgi:hypothetical protein
MLTEVLTCLQCKTPQDQVQSRDTVIRMQPLMAMPGNGFQQRISPFLCVPELSPTSATSFSQKQLTNEPQRLSD